jgi:hypothetical protein
MDQEYYDVPKRDLIIGLQVLLQRREFQIAGGLPHGPTLVQEMRDMQVKVTPSGNEQCAAWREGTHDELVFAVSLACWGLGKIYKHPLQRNDRWRTNGQQEEAERLFRADEEKIIVWTLMNAEGQQLLTAMIL